MTKPTAVLLLSFCFLAPLASQTKKVEMRIAGVYVPPKHQRANNKLPNEIKASLDTQFPAWTFVDNYYIFDALDGELKQKEYQFDSNFIIGDFDGDNHQDYAIQITNPDQLDSTDLVLAFLWRPGGFKQFLLESMRHFYPTDEYLWLSRKGTQGYNVESDGNLIFPRDAITIEIWEKASTSYIYSHGEFTRIVTGD
jgi:hypothetical protein